MTLVFPGCVLADSGMAADLEASPLFSSTALPAGVTQYLDDYQRSSFWSSVSTVSPDYHLLLDPSDIPAVTLHVPASQGLTVFDPFTNRIQGVVGGAWLYRQLLSLMNSLHVSPTTLPIFVPYNTYVTDQNPNDCLTPQSCGFYLGFHAAVPSNQKPHAINTFAFASYLDLGTELPPSFDIGTEVASHEILEWAADPFVHNIRIKGQVTTLINTAPAWSSPFYGAGSLCANFLEVADPLEGGPLLFASPVGSSTNYLLADAAFLPWFARESPSSAIFGIYDLGGIFSTYSASC